MFLLEAVSLLLALSSAVLAGPTGLKSSVVEALEGPPAGWTRDGSAKLNKDTSRVKLRINLVQQDMDKFHELAMNVRYGSSLAD